MLHKLSKKSYILKFENIISRRTTHQIETKVFTKGIQESNNQFVILLLFFFSSAFNSHHDVSLFVTLIRIRNDLTEFEDS